MRVPYPLRAASLNINIRPFSWRIVWRKRQLTEFAKEQGETIWWLQIGPIHLSYARLL